MHRMATNKIKMLGRTSRGQATLNCNSNILVWQRIQDVCMLLYACERASEQFALSLSLSRIGFLHDESKVLKNKSF